MKSRYASQSRCRSGIAGDSVATPAPAPEAAAGAVPPGGGVMRKEWEAYFTHVVDRILPKDPKVRSFLTESFRLAFYGGAISFMGATVNAARRDDQRTLLGMRQELEDFKNHVRAQFDKFDREHP